MRRCTCAGCSACKLGGCSQLYKIVTGSTKRCPACQQNTDRQRDQQRGTTTQRGYDGAHKAERQRQVDAFTPGQPCARCGKPIASVDDADLGHVDDDRSRYSGLEHRRCNRATKGRHNRRPTRPRPAVSQPLAEQPAEPDDDWCGIL
jgi:endogenous inhibitor of DNA gyrase (YacG/DUF329 family)